MCARVTIESPSLASSLPVTLVAKRATAGVHYQKTGLRGVCLLDRARDVLTTHRVGRSCSRRPWQPGRQPAPGSRPGHHSTWPWTRGPSRPTGLERQTTRNAPARPNDANRCVRQSCVAPQARSGLAVNSARHFGQPEFELLRPSSAGAGADAPRARATRTAGRGGGKSALPAPLPHAAAHAAGVRHANRPAALSFRGAPNRKAAHLERTGCVSMRQPSESNGDLPAHLLFFSAKRTTG